MSNGPQNGRTFFYPPRLSLGFEAPRTFGNKAKYKDAFIAFDNYHLGFEDKLRVLFHVKIHSPEYSNTKPA